MSTNVEIGSRRIEDPSLSAIDALEERRASSVVYFFNHARAPKAAGLES